MDWSSLKTLDLDDRCPENLFTALAGYVPNLNFLRLLLTQGNDPEMQCGNMSVVRKFINAIDGLEELYIRNCYEKFFEAAWPRIKRHCSSLKVLDIHTHCGFTNWPRWTMLELDYLLEMSQGLEVLSIDMGFINENAAISENNRLIWVCRSFRELHQTD